MRIQTAAAELYALLRTSTGNGDTGVVLDFKNADRIPRKQFALDVDLSTYMDIHETRLGFAGLMLVTDLKVSSIDGNKSRIVEDAGTIDTIWLDMTRAVATSLYATVQNAVEDVTTVIAVCTVLGAKPVVLTQVSKIRHEVPVRLHVAIDFVSGTRRVHKMNTVAVGFCGLTDESRDAISAMTDSR